jgi:hypothetical protein
MAFGREGVLDKAYDSAAAAAARVGEATGLKEQSTADKITQKMKEIDERNKISETASEMGQQAQDSANSMSQKVKSALGMEQSPSEKAQDLANQAQNSASSIGDRVKRSLGMEQTTAEKLTEKAKEFDRDNKISETASDISKQAQDSANSMGHKVKSALGIHEKSTSEKIADKAKEIDEKHKISETAQNMANDGMNKARNLANDGANEARHLDQKHGVSEKISEAGSRVGKAATEALHDAKDKVMGKK